MRFVTTCHKEGFEYYGHRLLEGWRYMPKDAELWWYTEGYDLPPEDRVVQKDITQIADLMAFKERHKYYVPPEFDVDVVRFSHKVYAAVDALMDYEGIGVWIDADCVPYKSVTEEMVAKWLNNAYIACFQRAGFYTETGLWIVDGSQPVHKPFMTVWKRWYDQDKFPALPGWTDCHTLDATIHLSKSKVENLSGEFGSLSHPMAKTEIGRYIDHCKGDRKRGGISSENEFHKEYLDAAA